ncbi:MAG: hypothetical protein AB8I08_09900 [Sandaracinaceae bacterium]
MNFVRRYRKVIMLVFGLMALAGISYGYMKKAGWDPLEALRPDEATQADAP